MSLRIFVAHPLVTGLVMALEPAAARHVQVRRMQPDERVVLFDGRGGEWGARIVAMRRDGVDVRVLEHHAVDRELPFAVTLAMGVPTNERMDWLVEKATELGVACIRPLRCERSVIKLEGERAARKRAHWQAVAVAAAEQCGRTRLPVVEAVGDLRDTLSRDDDAQRWLLQPRLAPPPPRPASGSSFVLLSGPEGGLAPGEERAALESGWQPVHLGPRVLRAETAPLALLAWMGLQQ